MKSLQRKFKDDDDLAQFYRKEIQKNLDKEYIKKINGEQQEDNTKWFLLHYGLVSRAKLGKIRRIANAVAVFNRTRLNDHLLPGPELLNDLVGIILLSREKPILITAEIEGFFMQVDVRKEDSKFLRFLWNDDFNKPPKEFEYQRHIFGARDSPACAIYALQQAARDNAENYPDVLETVTTDLYMDDFVKSVGSTEEALQLHQRLSYVLGSHSCNLIKWCSNSRAFCNELHESFLTNEKDEIFTKNNRQKVLGVSLFPLTDMFAAHINNHNPDMLQKWTQRKLKLLGLISRIFDPLGTTAPVTLVMKIKLQEIWRNGQHWDQELPEDLQQFVKEWTTNTAHLNEIKIPLYYSMPTAQPTKHNPADEGTRGIKTIELKHSQWMNGPASFLKLPSHLWPRTIEETTPSTLENMLTSKTDDIQTYSLICNTPHTFVDYKQFSSWKRLLRTIFYIVKTMDLAKRRLSTVKERYQRSIDILFRVTQNESFPEDIKDIQRTQAVKAGSKIVNFNPYLDQQGTLRSLSRLQKAESTLE